MKISVQTQGVIDVLGVKEGFSLLKKVGFEAVDFGIQFYEWRPNLKYGVEHEMFADRDKFFGYINEVKEAAEENGIEIGQMHAPGPVYIVGNEKSTQMVHNAIEMTMEACGMLGCHKIVVHPCMDGDVRNPRFFKEDEYDVNMSFYSSFIPYLKKYNIVCCLENMYKLDNPTGKIYTACCSDMKEAAKYIDDLNAVAGEKLFGFCLDIGHLLLVGQEPKNAMKALGDRIVALHIHDNNGIDDSHIASYLGVCDWNAFINGLKEINYKGNINFETAGINGHFPKELLPEVLSLICSTGKYFRDRINSAQ